MRTIFQDWRDEHSQQTYPFHDHVDPVRFDGERIPFGLIVDALLHVPNSAGGYRLSAIGIAAPDITFTITDVTGAEVAAGTWSANRNDPSAVPLTSLETPNTVRGLPSGVLVVRPEVAEYTKQLWGDGQFDLQQQTTGFVPVTWEYTYSPVSNTSDELTEVEGTVIESTGDLYLVAENGVRMECVGGNTIRVHAIGDPLAKRDRCEDTVPAPRYIEELVFQHNDETIICSPGDSGEAWIIVAGDSGQESALRLYAQPSTLNLGFAARPN